MIQQTVRPEQSSAGEPQENNFKTNFTKMTEVLKEEMKKKSLKEGQESQGKNEQVKETVQDLKFLKMGIEAKTNPQAKIILEMESLDRQTVTTDIEYMTGKINLLIKENINLKIS